MRIIQFIYRVMSHFCIKNLSGSLAFASNKTLFAKKKNEERKTSRDSTNFRRQGNGKK